MTKQKHGQDHHYLKLTTFLKQLDDARLYYKLDTIRDDYILVEVAVPGERWEVEFGVDGDVVVERFKSMGDVDDERALAELFEQFAD